MDFETEMRNRIIRLEQKVDFLLKELNLTEQEAANSAITNPVFAEVIALLRQGKTIQAIKLYREKTGVSLKEAKETIEKYM
jgi:ribosomal protein L7/L12